MATMNIDPVRTPAVSRTWLGQRAPEDACFWEEKGKHLA